MTSSEKNAHPHNREPRYCERCGSLLSKKELEGRLLPVCPSCDFVVYRDPKVAAGVVVSLNGEVVLLKRGIEPGYGKWVFPGGYVDRGEPTRDAAERETFEEVGLHVESGDLLGVFSYSGVSVVLVAYECAVIDGELRGNHETLEVRTFQAKDIPWGELAFQSTEEVLRLWVERRSE